MKGEKNIYDWHCIKFSHKKHYRVTKWEMIPTSGINGTVLIVTLIPIRLAIRFVLDSDWLIILDLAK